MKKKHSAKTPKMTRDAKDVVTLVFIFSLIVGIILTTYIANQTLGNNSPITQAAGPRQ